MHETVYGMLFAEKSLHLVRMISRLLQYIVRPREFQTLHCCCGGCVQVSTDQQEAEKVKIVVAAEEQEIGVMQQHTQAIAEEAKADLAEAMPALQAAIDSLKALNKNDIVEVGPCLGDRAFTIGATTYMQGLAIAVGFCTRHHVKQHCCYCV